MRKLLLLLVVLFTVGLSAQQRPTIKGSKTMKVTYLGESPSLRKMSLETKSRSGRTGTYIVPNKLTKTGMIESIQNSNTDPVIQRNRKLNAPVLRAPALKNSFDGGSNADNAAVNGFNVAPPDTQGDVGPNHYVQMVNSVTTIFDKNGTTLLGPVPGSAFFQNLDPRLAGTNDGDPVALYDQFEDRWIVSQFAVSAGAPYAMLIAVSTTSDPTGTYNQYAIDYGDDFPDYPKLGVWNEAIFITTRDFTGSPLSFKGFSVAAINKFDMYAGNPTEAQRFEILDPEFDGIVPADADGTSPPPLNEPHYSMYLSASGNFLNLITTSIDFSDSGNSTISFSTVPVAPYSFFQAQVPQPNGQTLDALPFFLMFRLQYINFGTHASMVVNHSVQEVTGGDFGIRWYEFRDTGAPWAVYQQGTYLPGDGLSRWMGSIAMNLNGDIALGYSVAGETLNPSIRFVGQTADQSGTGVMNIPETSLLEGTLSSRGTNRWGDYAMMSMDPSDDDFWFTTEYIAVDQAFSGWGTNISEFGLEGGPEAICQDITVQLDATGNATITADQIDNGSNGDGEVTLSISTDTFTCENIGENSVVLTVTDGNGVVSNCTATVTVEDAVAPTAVCQDITIPLNGAGEASIVAEDIDGGSTDNCGVASLSVDISSFTTSDLGDNTVTLTVTDSSGISSTCTATVTVVSERPIIGVDPTSFDVTLQTDETTTENLTINNTGEADLDFSISVTNELAALGFTQNVTTTNTAIAASGFTQINAASADGGLSGLFTNNGTLNAFVGDLYATDFEDFSLGDISGQMGWFGSIAGVWNVSNAAPFEGAQHLRGVSSGSGDFTFGLTPNFTAGTEDVSTMTARVNIQGSGVTWEIAPQDPAAGFVVTRLAFFADGTIGVLDGATGTFVPLTGISVPSGYFNVTISVDRNTAELKVLFNNELVYTGTSIGTIIENVAFLSSQEAGGSTFDVDNLDVTDGVVEAPNFLTFLPENGTVAPGGSVNVAVTFDAAGLEPAVYNSTINIGSNDPDTPNVDVPAQLTVTGVADTDIVINEFLANYPGTDTFEFLEVFGTPSTDYSNLTLLEIEGDGTGAGEIDEVIPVGTTDANGIWVATFEGSVLENGSATYLLVSGFTGTAGDDLDADDDGNFDTTPWDSLIDDVGKTDGGADDQVYSSVVLTPGFSSGSGAPAGASRIPNGTDTDALEDWAPNDPDGAGLLDLVGTPEPGEALNTPGAINELILDNNPPNAVCQDITVQLDASGNATIVPSDVDGGSSDVEGIASLAVSQSSFTCADLGPNNITLTVTDTDGAEATCTAVVTVVDEIAPTVTCNDITVELGFDGTVTIAPEDLLNDGFLYALEPTLETGYLSRFDYEPASDAISFVDGTGNTTGVKFAIDQNPVDGMVYAMVDIEGSAGSGGNVDRSLYTYDLETGNTISKVASLVSSTGATNPNAMTFGADGTLYIAYGDGSVEIFDFDTLTSAPFATPAVFPGGVGMTYDFDNDRIIYNGWTDIPRLYEIALDGTSNILFDLEGPCVPGAQAMEYIGSDKIVASATFGCPTIFIIDMTTGATTDILTDNPNGNIKDLLFTGAYAFDNCGDPTLTLSQDTFTEAGTFEVTVTATDASGNSSSCVASVTVEEGDLVGPIIGVDPDSFDVTQAPDVTTTESLTISNTGDTDLDFDISVTEGAIAVQFEERVQATNVATANGSTLASFAASANATELSALRTLDGNLFAIEGDLYGEDFEDFVLGEISGQMGWLANAGFWNIANTNPFGGTQHISSSSDASGLAPVAFSPAFSSGTAPITTFSSRINIEGGGSTWELAPQNPTEGLIVTSILFLGDGSILIADANTLAYELVPVSVPSGYFKVDVVVDRTTLDMDLFIDGTLAYSGLAFATATEEVVLVSYNEAAGSTINIDDIAVTDGDINEITYVSVAPESGTVPPGGSTTLAVTFDSNGLVPDVYNASINVSSNDPNNPSVDVPVTLTVVEESECEVVIETQPEDATICAGDPIGFDVDASGPGSLTYQWQVDDGSGSGFVDLGDPSENSELNFAFMEIGGDGNQYRVVVMSDNGTPENEVDDCSTTSDIATLTVNPLPVVTFTALADVSIDAGVQAGLSGGNPAQGTEADDSGEYSGPGVTDNGDGTYDFDPVAAGLGITTITYTYTNGSGCEASASDEVEVLPGDGPTDCPDFLPNEDPGIVINSGGGIFLGLDAAFGTSDVTNGSPCALALQNNDAGQPFASFRIPLDLSTYGIIAGDELFISLDALNNGGVARIEVLQNNQPNTALASNTYSGSGWETYSTTITVPSGLASIDIWLYSNYLSSNPGTAYYDNLIIQNLTAGGGNVDPIANAGVDRTVTDGDGNGSADVTLDGSGSFDPDGTIVSYSWSNGTGEIATGETPLVTLPIGVNNLTLTVTDDDGATDTDTVTITVKPATACPNNLPNEDPSIPLSGQGGFQGLDSFVGTSIVTNGSPCALMVTNNDSGQPFANYRIPINLAALGINAGDELFISLDGNSSEGVARIEVNQDNQPNTALASNTYTGGWSNFSATVIVPSGISTINLWLYSNYLSGAPGTAYYDNLIVSNLSAGGGNIDPIADAGSDQTVVDTDENGSEDVTLDGSGSFDLDGTIVDYAWSNGSTGVSPTATFPVGETTVTLTVTDDDGATATDTVVITVVDPGAPCPDELPNEDSIVLTGDGGFQGLDSFQGTSSVTNGSPCALEVTNNDVGQPFANYRIPIPLAANGISPGDQLFISLDGNSSQGVARIEVNQDNRPNTALAFNTYVGGWSTFSQTITVPSGITSLNIWLYSNYLDFGSGGTAYYDNLIVRKLGPTGLEPITSRASLNSMRLSPNPANVTSNLSFEKPEEIKEILIFDMAGRMVQRFDADEIRRGEHYEMDVYSMPVGTYIIRSRSTQGIEYSGQMVIER